MKLNELEYVCEIISKNQDLVSKYYGIDINTLLVVGRDVLLEHESTWGSSDRGKKLKAIKSGLKY